MANSPVVRSIKVALEANAFQGKLFTKVGSNAHPYGVVSTAYRNAYRALKSAMAERNRIAASTEVLTQLRTMIKTSVTPILQASATYSQQYAAKQLSLFGDTSVAVDALELSVQVNSAMDAVIKGVDSQIAKIINMMTVGLDDNLILGDGNHVGLLRPVETITNINFWISSLLWTNFERSLRNSTPTKEITWGKVAVAALDHFTTDCCLHVHGQVVPLDDPFILEGTPRFANELDWAPFHWHCRTSIALKRNDIEDPVIEDLRSSAETLLKERENGIYQEKRPANAYYP